MPNVTYILDFADNPGELGIEFNTGINFEIRLSDTILAGMANKNYETTFTLGIDPAHGVTLEYGNSRWAQFSEDPFSRLPVAPLPQPQESPVEQRTTAELPQDPTEARSNEAGQSEDEEDEEWLNEIAATLVPVRRPKLPDQDPLASTGRAKSTAHPRGSSLHTTQKVSSRLSSSASHPVPVQTPDHDPDETEDEDWKQMGATALRRAVRRDLTPTVPEHPYAPTAPRPNTQGGESRNQRAAVGSSRESGGRRGREKRKREVETDPVRASRAKKTKC